jgi:hypothetical protein
VKNAMMLSATLAMLLSGCATWQTPAPPVGQPIPATGDRVMRAVTIGLDRVNPAAHGGWSGDLSDCEFDAKFAAQVWKSFGVPTTTLLTARATREGVKAALRDSVAGLKDGDWLIVWLSGHGGQEKDQSGDESDRLDEYVCLYDGPLSDDVINDWLSKTPEGVRILWICDTCHSGTMHRRPPVFGPRAVREFKGQLILISGCAESGTSLSTGQGGVLSTALHDTGPEGQTPSAWARDARARIPPTTQVPQYVEYGQVSDDFRFGEIVPQEHAARVSLQEIIETPPEELLQSWWTRQKTAVLDWMRRVLNLPDPHQPEPPAPPTPDAQPWGVRSESSLWKPVSENDGKVATLFPSSYRRRDAQKHPSDATVDPDHAFTAVYLRGPDGDTIESSPRSWSYGNSERWHARWRKPGEDYPDGVEFVLKLESGKLAVFRVGNPSRRESPKAKIADP